MKSTFLIGGNSFIKQLETYIISAKKSVYIQAMTFEADSAGKKLIKALIKSKAKDKRLLIDKFSQVVSSDKLIYGLSYLKDPDLRYEVQNTKRLLKYAKSKGIQVKFTNPLGFLLCKFFLRNHKKMMIIDEKISYLGGINFSDHNFEWYDFMLELIDKQLGHSLAKDFQLTWNDINQSEKVKLDFGQLYFLNRQPSRSLYEELFKICSFAKKEIIIASPYVSEPLLSFIKNTTREDIKVKIITPSINNKKFFFKYIMNEYGKGYFDLFTYNKGMFHIKAIIIDKEKLIFGSSNFDFASYHFEQEVILVLEEELIVKKFISTVLNNLMDNSVHVDSNKIKQSYKIKIKLVLFISKLLAKFYMFLPVFKVFHSIDCKF